MRSRVRLALGARRGRLVRQLLTESLVVSLLGGAIGLGVAKLGIAGLLALSAGQLPRAADVVLDTTVVSFAFGLSLASGLLFGIVPALRTSQNNAQMVLQDTRRSVAGPGNQRVRAVLVVAEVAVAMALVVGAGLMSRSFMALLDVDAGFRPDHLLAVQFTIDPDRHGGVPPARAADGARPRLLGSPYSLYYERVINEVRRFPGVVSAAAVKDPPFRGNGERNGFNLPGRPVPAGEDPPTATVIHVSDGYFATIGAKMIGGREFTAQDRGDSPPVVVVNEAFARQFFPGERAVGKTLLFGRNVPVEIIGVVNDIRQVAMAEPARPTMYLGNLQNSRVKTTIVARTSGDPLAMANAVRQKIWAIDPNQAITAVFTFDDAVSRALARPRLLTVLLGAFGLVGLALGVVGIYGMLAALVNERRREIGVRLALGARPGQVLMMVVGRGLALATGRRRHRARGRVRAQPVPRLGAVWRPPAGSADVRFDGGCAPRRGGDRELAAGAPRGGARSGRDAKKRVNPRFLGSSSSEEPRRNPQEPLGTQNPLSSRSCDTAAWPADP